MLALFCATWMGTAAAAPMARPVSLPLAFASAAHEAQVPVELLGAIAFEASGLRIHEDASAWGGRTMFDLAEADESGGPSLERASSLVGASPDLLLADWRIAVRGAAALLADEARQINGGLLPPTTELDAWQPAVAAFSGRHEPRLQALYVEGVYTLLFQGFEADSKLGHIRVGPQNVTVQLAPAPPPGSTDYAGADSVPACTDNYSDDSRGEGSIDMIVIHTVQGSYSGCASWFANCSAQASAHYVVRSRDGAVTQMVRETDIAWHAGNWDYNSRSVGIEHEGYVSDCSYYTEALYNGSAALALDIATRQGVPLDRSHFIGHDEVPDPDGSGYGGSGNHTDPGSCWDWDYYMSIISDNSGTTTGEILGYVRENDIYNTAGNRVGATVWVEETGDVATVDTEGLYRFTGMPFGAYTIHASDDGFEEGTCTASLNDTQGWCSIALLPGEGQAPEGGTTLSMGHPRPGQAVPLTEVAACASGPSARNGLAGLSLALLAAAKRRR